MEEEPFGKRLLDNHAFAHKKDIDCMQNIRGKS
jgi:hypothetical protein